MGLNSIVRSRGFKNFMAKLYGWGASVVIVGALFKITHIPGADEMLFIGLGTEAIIFFFSAFEPPHVEPDWSLVYPELAGMYHGISAEEEEEEDYKKKGTNDLDRMLEEADIGPQLIEKLGSGLRNLSDNTSKLAELSNATVATEDYLKNVQSASKSVSELSNSYRKTSETLDQDLSVSEEYFNHVKNASQKAANLSGVYDQATEALKGDLDVTKEFSGSLKSAIASVNALTEKYNQSADLLSKSAESLDFSKVNTGAYNEELKKISDNLSSLNAVYEMQLKNSKSQNESSEKLQNAFNQFVENLNQSVENQKMYTENISSINTNFKNQIKGSTEQIDATNKLKETLDEFLNNLKDSSERTQKYNQELDDLAKKVSALNNVYGNMLTAMNVDQKKA